MIARERQLEQVLSQNGWWRVPNRKYVFMHHEKGLFLSVDVDDRNMGGSKVEGRFSLV